MHLKVNLQHPPFHAKASLVRFAAMHNGSQNLHVINLAFMLEGSKTVCLGSSLFVSNSNKYIFRLSPPA